MWCFTEDLIHHLFCLNLYINIQFHHILFIRYFDVSECDTQGLTVAVTYEPAHAV